MAPRTTPYMPRSRYGIDSLPEYMIGELVSLADIEISILTSDRLINAYW